ncbi:N-acetylmuramoyl-L-alanine amidase [Halobacillus seohaensis]|uniref:N-acetylmuramoyl-L-alanine amidase n=1 Tax=Halobacillus seohaensis TaxID=447421 RepID=A0ABW2EKV3_9BACI
MSKKLLSLLFALFVISFGFFDTEQHVSANSINDIPSKYENEINYLIQKEIVEGFPDNTFKPKNDVSREEAATMIGRSLGYNDEKQDTTFSDVPSSSYASGYIASATQNNIITGYPEGVFKPKQTITRGEMAVMISKSFNLQKESDQSFSDVSKSHKYFEYIKEVASSGVAAGYPDGGFKPNKEITREEFSLFVARSLNSEYRVQQESSEDAGNSEVIDEQVVTADYLNVRKGPSTNYGIVGSLSTGSAVSVYEENGNWAYISKGNVKGWVSQSYLIDKPQSSHIIALDPGHGGSDPGASANGLIEKNVVLDVSLTAREYLEDAGIDVAMTRQTDWYPSLDGRVKIAQDKKADAFVSVHANAFGESANGVETFYSASGLSDRAYRSMKLAEFINDRLYKEMDMTDRGVKEAGFRVIKANPLPSVLTEIGFLTNDEDVKKLKTDHYREAAARAIALGVVDYYNWKEE